MDKRSPLQWFMLSLKGAAMGAADVVPGVSGGTIAFISGIYEELIDSINKINFEALRILKKNGFKSFWSHINGTFFAFLFSGILISIASLAKTVTYFLENHPVLIWSFFFGLIMASVWLVGKTIQKWTPVVIVALALGIAIAYYITSIQTIGHAESRLFIFLSGAIAICAMILPGISGSFILVILGSYHVVLNAVKDKDLLIIGIFGLGCVIGLLTFARILKFLFSRFKEITIALLTGFMIGSLNKVWPWKIKIGDAPILVHSNGREEWLMKNVSPSSFEGDNQLVFAMVCLLGGFLTIIILERFAPKGQQ